MAKLKRFFSPSAGAFYSEAVHGPRQIRDPEGGKLIANPACTIPADAVRVTDSQFEQLFAAQAEGKQITWTGSRLRAVDPKPDGAQVEAANRTRRNKLLLASDWTQLPDAPLSPEQRAAWSTYRQQLRDLKLARPLPESAWPKAPEGTH